MSMACISHVLVVVLRHGLGYNLNLHLTFFSFICDKSRPNEDFGLAPTGVCHETGLLFTNLPQQALEIVLRSDRRRMFACVCKHSRFHGGSYLRFLISIDNPWPEHLHNVSGRAHH